MWRMRYLEVAGGVAVVFATSTRVRLLLEKSVIHNQVLCFLCVHDAFAARERGVCTGRTCVGRSDLCGSFEWRKFAVSLCRSYYKLAAGGELCAMRTKRARSTGSIG